MRLAYIMTTLSLVFFYVNFNLFKIVSSKFGYSGLKSACIFDTLVTRNRLSSPDMAWFVCQILTCSLSLLIYRLLEKKIDESIINREIIETSWDMEIFQYKEEGYIPVHTRTNLTDKSHVTFNLRTGTEIVSVQNIKKILKHTKKYSFFEPKKPQALQLQGSCGFNCQRWEYHLNLLQY